MSNWKAEMEAKRAASATKRMERILAAPPARGELYSSLNELRENTVSIALALESMEKLLIQRGILKEDELMDALTALIKVKAEQLSASDATQSHEGRIIHEQ